MTFPSFTLEPSRSFHFAHHRNKEALAALTGSPEPGPKRFFCLCPLWGEDNPQRSAGQAPCLGDFLPGADGAALPAGPELLQGLSLPRAHLTVCISP